MTASATQTAVPLDARLLKQCRADITFALLPPYSEMEAELEDMVFTLFSALLWGRRDIASMVQRVDDEGVLSVNFTVELAGRRRECSELMEETGKLAWAVEADQTLSLWRHPQRFKEYRVSDYLRRFLDHLRKTGMEDQVILVGLEERDVAELGLKGWLEQRRETVMGNLYLLLKAARKALGRALTDDEVTTAMQAAFEGTDADNEYVRRLGVLVWFAVENAKNLPHAKAMITDLLPPVG